MRKILVVAGTHSGAMLMAPLVFRLRELPSIQTIVRVTAQDSRSINQVFSVFGIRPDEESGLSEQVASPGGSHVVDLLLEKHKPDCVLIHGGSDTAEESRYLRAPVSNNETGMCLHELRHSGTPDAGGSAIDLIATNYFVPSEASRDNLLSKGIASEKIYLTDSILVDGLMIALDRIRNDVELKARLAAEFPFLEANKRLILVTAHRHDNHEGRLENLCRALKRLAMRPDVQIIYPVHQNPKLNDVADMVFAGHPGITLIQPQDYLHFVYLMQTAYLILTDLDDSLKEALSMSKPVLVTRDIFERPQAIDAGTIKFVGTEAERIVRECTMFLDDPSYYCAFSVHRNPYGEGHASLRILATLLR